MTLNKDKIKQSSGRRQKESNRVDQNQYHQFTCNNDDKENISKKANVASFMGWNIGGNFYPFT